MFLVLIGSVVLAAAVKKTTTPAPTPRVLMIGDSLSVASFGEVLQHHLEGRYGRGNVAFFASCGSSPENWLRDESVFYTKCGYRERTPTTDVYSDFHNGKPPPPTRTPKIESLIEKYKPAIVVVQLGTNWMDRSLSDDKIRSILDRFMTAAHRGGKRRVLWITPPDSSRFSKVQSRIYKLIVQAKPSGDYIINSRRITDYLAGKTGGDGVHYNRDSGEAWARKVIDQYDEMFPKARKVAAAE
ncbi:MAG: SGNH/GDSL hydrolase family protein [Verrucomicrobiota bacterium]